ncbi:ATP-binding protein [Hellea sp.]|nr:ATP-binding protein [Hellea sp.]
MTDSFEIDNMSQPQARVKIRKENVVKLLKDNAFLFPFDILVLLFLAQTMLPVWAAIILALINFGTWYCYYKIPEYLRTVSGSAGENIIIPGHIIAHFAQFVSSCGIHHRAHYGLMLAMMAGFHSMMAGQIWGTPIGHHVSMAVAYTALFLLIAVDLHMLWRSVRAMQELRADKLREVAEYTVELERSNEDLEQFAYIASHDLRAPLRAMHNLVGWIEQDIGQTSNKSTTDNLYLLKQRINRLDNLLNDLLQYSRIGRKETTQETIDLHELTKNIFNDANPDDKHKLHMSGNPVIIKDYKVIYDMLLGNLLVNSIKHNDKPVTDVWVEFEKQGSNVTISVEDNGPGIDPKYREKVFNVFTTLSRRDEKEASGMGLAIVKKISSHKKGKVTVSDSEKGGAKFEIVLPVMN